MSSSCPPSPQCDPPCSCLVDYDSECSCASCTSRSTTLVSPSYQDQSTQTIDPATDHLAYANPVAYPVVVIPNASYRMVHAPSIYAWPSPVLAMIQRATFDMHGLHSQHVNPFAFEGPIRLFTPTGGRVPQTGFDLVDQQSSQYYAIRPSLFLARIPDKYNSYYYPFSALEAIRHTLSVHWMSVFPPPIPIVVIRLADIVGPSFLHRRTNGSVNVIPAADSSLWSTFCQRGVDQEFRPLHPLRKIEMRWVILGRAVYFPQHVIASNFTVNVFVERPDVHSDFDPPYEYIGAYIMQRRTVALTPSEWATTDPEVQQSILNRVPDPFMVHGRPCFPLLRLIYYKWDSAMVGLADRALAGDIPVPTRDISIHEAEPGIVDSDDHFW